MLKWETLETRTEKVQTDFRYQAICQQLIMQGFGSCYFFFLKMTYTGPDFMLHKHICILV